MILIPLTQGYTAKVDDGDSDLAQFRWSAAVRKSKHNTVIYGVRWDAPNRKLVLMHRVIMGQPACNVDHKDGDGTNNQRANLRLASRSLNNANQTNCRGSKSGYKGVHRYYKNTWQATATLNGVTHKFGVFGTPEEAAEAYDRGAQELFGDFARVNAGKKVKCAK